MNFIDSTVKVGYLVKRFPRITQGFILREIVALESGGVNLQIFTLEPPQENLFHSLNAQVRAKVAHLPASVLDRPLRLVWAHLVMLLTYPIGYLRALRFIVGRSEAGRLRDFLQAGYLARLLRRERLQHLHAHFINEPAGVAEIVHRMIDIPYSVTARAKDIYRSSQPELMRKMSRAKFVVACNEHHRGFLSRLAPGGTPILRIYDGLDGQLFKADSARKNLDQVPLILSVGRLCGIKDFDCLLSACHLLKVGGQKFRCVIVGYGPLKEELEARVASLGLDGTVFLSGMLTQDSLIDLYNQATLFVLPYQTAEGGDHGDIPNSLAEAMAMELPVVSTDRAGVNELIESGREGLLLRPGDAVGVAAAIKQLLDQPALRRELASAGREKICRLFSARKNALQLTMLFRATPSAMGEKRPAPAGVTPFNEAPDSAI